MANRFRARVAVYLLLQKGGKFLLLRRYQTGWHDGDYSLVAGHVDPGESATAAIVRESKEEAGITINPSDLYFVHVMFRGAQTGEADTEYVDFYFTTDKYEGELHNAEPEKCDKLTWFPADDLPDNIVPGVKQAIYAARDGLDFSEFGWK